VAVETKKEDGVVSFREKDLDGHLSPQSGGTPQQAKPQNAIVVDVDAGAAGPEGSGSEAKNVADDPEKGSDGVLKVGWRVLRARMASAPPSR